MYARYTSFPCVITFQPYHPIPTWEYTCIHTSTLKDFCTPRFHSGNCYSYVPVLLMLLYRPDHESQCYTKLCWPPKYATVTLHAVPMASGRADPNRTGKGRARKSCNIRAQISKSTAPTQPLLSCYTVTVTFL